MGYPPQPVAQMSRTAKSQTIQQQLKRIFRMYPIDQLNACRAGEAPIGSILLGAGSAAPRLRFDSNDQQLAIPLAGGAQTAFHGTNVTTRVEPELALANWSLRVDHQTAFSPFSGIPEIGQAFLLADGTAGFLIRLDRFARYVTTDGGMINEPGVDERAVFFRSWSIGVELDHEFVEITSFGVPEEEE